MELLKTDNEGREGRGSWLPGKERLRVAEVTTGGNWEVDLRREGGNFSG